MQTKRAEQRERAAQNTVKAAPPQADSYAMTEVFEPAALRNELRAIARKNDGNPDATRQAILARLK